MTQPHCAAAANLCMRLITATPPDFADATSWKADGRAGGLDAAGTPLLNS
jgi:hypothetical protein